MVRPGGFHWHRTEPAGGARLAAGPIAARTGRSGKAQARRAQRRRSRTRQFPAPRYRAFPTQDRHRHRDRAVQGRRAGADRYHCRSSADERRQRGAKPAACALGKTEGAWCRRQQTDCSPARGADFCRVRRGRGGSEQLVGPVRAGGHAFAGACPAAAGDRSDPGCRRDPQQARARGCRGAAHERCAVRRPGGRGNGKMDVGREAGWNEGGVTMGDSMQPFKAFKLDEVDRKIRAGFVDMRLDDLDPGEVVVRVAYSDVNYKDALAATGKGRILLRPSCIGGIDLSGTVVSSTDARFAKGDAVLAVGHELGVKHHGGYAEYARIPAKWAVKRPKGMTLWEAMAFGTAGYTAGLAG